MSIDSGAEALPRKNRRVAKRSVEGDISPGLRKHITQAAEKIRGAHKAELADVHKADRASRLFSRIIGPNGTPVGPEQRVVRRFWRGRRIAGRRTWRLPERCNSRGNRRIWRDH